MVYLQGPTDEELQAALYEVMGCMRDVRKRTEKTDAMFKPLGQCVELLGKYGITLDEKTLKQLEEVRRPQALFSRAPAPSRDWDVSLSEGGGVAKHATRAVSLCNLAEQGRVHRKNPTTCGNEACETCLFGFSAGFGVRSVTAYCL